MVNNRTAYNAGNEQVGYTNLTAKEDTTDNICSTCSENMSTACGCYFNPSKVSLYTIDDDSISKPLINLNEVPKLDITEKHNSSNYLRLTDLSGNRLLIKKADISSISEEQNGNTTIRFNGTTVSVNNTYDELSSLIDP